MGIALPFKDQKAASSVGRQLNDHGSKINISFRPVFLSEKLEHELKIMEKKPSIVNQQRVVYLLKCSFCDEDCICLASRNMSVINTNFDWLIISISTLKS